MSPRRYVRAGEVMTKSERIDWVDYAKGISIILVVMMHSTLSSEEALGAAGWLHGVVEFARPFRIPAFFLIAGLFVARTIDPDWRNFLDRKILHFAYFYVLWLTIQFVFRRPVYVAECRRAGALRLYLLAFIDPFGTLWFIYLLPVFYLVTRLTRVVPPALVLIAAAALEIAPIETGWTLIDEFAGRFVYFYAGYLFGAWILDARGLDPQAAALAALAAICGLRARQRRGAWPACRNASVRFARTRICGRRGRDRDFGAARAPRLFEASAIAGRTRSSSISPSSCRWR